MMRALLIVILIALGCGGDDDDGGDSFDAAPQLDAAPQIDADPSCQQLDSLGGFPDCSVCDGIGSGCDTIDVNGQVSRVCDCTGPCPCGLRCGSVEIAPNIFVSNICIR